MRRTDRWIGFAAAVVFLFAGQTAIAQTIEEQRQETLASLALDGMPDRDGISRQAIELFEAAGRLSSGTVSVVAAQIYAHAVTGNEEEARELMSALETRRRSNEYVSPLRMAQAHAGQVDYWLTSEPAKM